MLFATFWLHGPRVPTVTLRHNASGYAVLGGADNPVNRPARWVCPSARQLLVSPPGSSRQTMVSGFLWRSPNRVFLPLCGGKPWVEPIRSDPYLAH
jgi:hypothetical protein